MSAGYTYVVGLHLTSRKPLAYAREDGGVSRVRRSHIWTKEIHTEREKVVYRTEERLRTLEITYRRVAYRA